MQEGRRDNLTFIRQMPWQHVKWWRINLGNRLPVYHQKESPILLPKKDHRILLRTCHRCLVCTEQKGEVEEKGSGGEEGKGVGKRRKEESALC